MQEFKLASYRWERTFLYLEFDESTPLDPRDGLTLAGWQFDPELDARPKEVSFAMTSCYVEGPTTMRVRFMLGHKGNPVRSGDYQLLVNRLGGEYPIVATEEQVHPATTSHKRSDVLLFAKTSSYYEVIPLVFDDKLYCTIGSRSMPPKFEFQSKQNMKKAQEAFVRATIDRFAVKTFEEVKAHFPVKNNKVLFTSDSRMDLSGNMEPLYDRMVERGLDKELDIVFSFKSGGDVSSSRSPFSYAKLAYHLATSRVIFCDDYQPYLYHVRYPKGTRLVQLWHACGHFKTVGWGRVGTLDAGAPFTNSHRNYTDVIVASESDVPIYGEAFGVMDECVKPFGIPRHDWLLKPEWQEEKIKAFKELFPKAAGKKVIIFAPTFRGSGKMTARYDYDKIDFSLLASFCRENGYYFIVKMHPFISEKPPIPEDADDVFADGTSVREINDLLPSADILITDYSSVVYEAALLDIPTLYFAYDLEDYVSTRSFYEPFEQFVSGKIVRTFDDLLDCMRTGDFGTDRLQEFRRKNFKYLDGKACDRIIDEIVLPAMAPARDRYTAADVRIISLSQDAAALNAQLDEVSEPFVLFVDDGAQYGDDYVEGVLSAFQNDDEMGAASGFVYNHRGDPRADEVDSSDKTIVHDAYRRFGQGVYLPYGVMYRTQVIRDNNLRFDEELAYCRDELFAIRYMECAGKNARVNRYTYRTAKVLDESGPKTPQSNDKRWYTDSTLPLLAKLSQAGAAGERPAGAHAAAPTVSLTRIAQYGILYLTVQRFKSNQGGLMKMVFDSSEEAEGYLAEVGEVMRHIDDEVLFSRARAVAWEQYKKIYLAELRHPERELDLGVTHVQRYAENEGASVRVDDAVLVTKGTGSAGTDVEICNMAEQNAVVTIMKYARDGEGRAGIDLHIRMQRCFPVGSFTLVVRSECGDECAEYEAVWETPVAGIVTFFDRYACRQDTYHAFVPLAAALGAAAGAGAGFGTGEGEDAIVQRITLQARFDGYSVPKKLGFSKISWASKLLNRCDSKYWYFDGHIAQLRSGAIVVRAADEMARLEAEVAYQEYLDGLAEQAAQALEEKPGDKRLQKQARIASHVAELRRRYWETLPQFEGRTIWTYNDKSYKAGDNAEYALRYAATQDDGIEKVFFIDPATKDGLRLAEEGYTVIDPSTIEGQLYGLHANLIHMTHVPAYTKLGLGPSILPYFNDLLNAKVVRMYHGYPITRSASYAQIADDSAGVVIGSEYERELYTNADNGFSPDQIIDSGMPRYDDLVDDSRRQILFAPTWRPALAGRSLGGGVSAYNPHFKDSDYFKLYEQVMNDERVLQTAREKGYTIKMFMHPKMNAQTVDFSKNDVVEALSCTEDIDYVTIMRQSDLMVTDFSSVQYDFAYMRKPVLYYHDPKLPYWRLVDFDYEAMGFGEVCTSADELAATLVDYMNRDCTMKEHYRKRVDEFFVHDDRESGRRLYEADLRIQES